MKRAHFYNNIAKYRMAFFISLFLTISVCSHAQVEDYGTPGPIHKKHIGQIVFSNHQMDYNTVNESELKSRFVLGKDRVYFMALMGQSLYNAAYKEAKQTAQGKEYFYFELNGERIPGECNVSGSNYMLWNEWTYINSGNEQLVENQPYTGTVGRHFIVSVVPKLKIGENKLKVCFTGKILDDNQNVIFTLAQPPATGEIAIVVNSQAELKAYVEQCGLLSKGVVFNSKWETEFKSRYKSQYPLKRIRVHSQDWDVKRDAFNTILERVIYADLILLIDGKYIAQPATLSQAYMGGGTYGQSVMTELNTETIEVPKILAE
jgi:hypothetical protein